MALGNAHDVRARGGSPFYLNRAGQRQGFFQEAVALALDKDKFTKIAWNFYRAVRFIEHGGYQFSRTSAELRFKRTGILFDNRVETVSQFPLYPPDSWLAEVETNYYIDATLRQNFTDYGLGDKVGRKLQREALARERDRYEGATRLLCMSRWAAASIIEDYGIQEGKIRVVPPGANIDEDLLEGAHNEDQLGRDLIRIGFNGRDWRRKNLVYLLQVAEALEAMGIAVEVCAAGFDVSSGPNHRLLRKIGYLDKKTSMRKVIEFVRSMHWGALFSHIDASSIANREFLRLGVPVLTWEKGGLADTVPTGMGKVFPADVPPVTVADYIAATHRKGEYLALRENVARRSHEVSWATTIRKFVALWGRQGDAGRL